MVSKKLTLFCAAFLFLILSASAETLSGDYSITYYQDAPIERTMIFKNTDAATKNFSLDVIGEKTPWTYVTATKETTQGFCASSQDIVLCTAPSDFSLAGNSQREIYFFSKAKTFAHAGVYSIDVLSSGKTLGTFTITVQQGHSLQLDAANTEQAAGQCEPKTFSLTVSNNGMFDEAVSVSVTGIPSDWISMPEQSFILNQGATKTIEVSVQAPCNQELAKNDFTAVAAIPKADVSVSKRLSFTIENKQGFSIADISPSNNIDACKEQKAQQSLSITNNGRLADDIELSIKAPEFVSLSEKSVSINPGATKTVVLSMEKTSAEEKQYSIELTAKSTKFGITATKTISVNLKSCYGAEIKKVSGAEKACLSDKVEWAFELKNTREKTISLSLATVGLKARLDKNKIDLKQGESQTVKATLDFSGETTGNKELQLNATSAYSSANQKSSIELVNCALEISPEKQVVDVNVSIGALTRISVTNKTLSRENIKMSVRGKDWILFNPKEFSLAPDEKKEVYMYISPPFYSEDSRQTVEITVRSDRYTATKAIDLNIFAGMQLGKADVILGNIEIKEIGSKKEISFTVDLKNDSNVTVTVSDINSPEFELKYFLRNNKILPNDSNPADLTVTMPKGFDENKFSIPLNIITEQGNFERFVPIDLTAKPSDQNAAAATLPIGLAFFSQPRNIFLIGVIIALIALIVYLALKGGEEETTEAETEETPTETISEQIKAKPKRKRKKKKR